MTKKTDSPKAEKFEALIVLLGSHICFFVAYILHHHSRYINRVKKKKNIFSPQKPNFLGASFTALGHADGERLGVKPGAHVDARVEPAAGARLAVVAAVRRRRVVLAGVRAAIRR